MEPNPEPKPPRASSPGIFYALPVLGWLYAWMLASLLFPSENASPGEKRSLAGFPDASAREVFSGRFFPAVSFWFADHFPARTAFLRTQSAVEPFKGVSWDSIRLYRHAVRPRHEEEWILSEREIELWAQYWRERHAALPSPGQPHPAEKKPLPMDAQRYPGKERPLASQASPAPEEVHAERVENVFIYGNSGFYIFGGSNRNADRYARAISKAGALLKGTARVYCLPVPTAIEILLPARYRSVTTPQRPFMTRISGALQDATFIDIHTDLINNRQKYLYYRTDHHWTPLGAYVAYERFAAAAGYAPNPLTAYQEIPIGRYWGSLYAATHSRTLGAHPDDVVAYKPRGKYRVTLYNRQGKPRGSGDIIYEGAARMSDKYTAFLGGDEPCIEIVNLGKPKNPRKILIFKESFGNVFAPFLAPDYQEVHVADIRTFPFGLSSYVREHGIQEVLFINNMFAACDPYRVREIERIVERP